MRDEQAADQATAQPSAPPNGYGAWNAYWTEVHNQPWRTEPEIGGKRQRHLGERRAIVPDIEKGLYPFDGMRLDRADVEWLLATHSSGGMRGPVDWDDAAQHKRIGLDLRGADLSRGNFRSLPLSRLRGGLAGDELRGATLEQMQHASLRLTGADLRFAHLEGSILTFGHLEGVDIEAAHLEMADMYRAHFEATHPADIGRAVFDSGSILNHVVFANEAGVGPQLADVQWNGAILAAVEWEPVRMLGEEYMARYGTVRRPWTGSLGGYPSAVRANRQISTELRTQGLHEEADKFAYRAQVLQRVVLRKQRKLLRYGGSLFLDLISGYGYRPMRSFIAYAFVIIGFAAAYFGLGITGGHPLAWNEALVVSMTSFHGRGFFPAVFQPGDVAAAVAAAEAFVGLLIEIIFIATFTQRFFAR
ncbi:MAG TPA: pentapeptide repeat-containing protein [Ktedonobacterales bacterium]|nr:pentapeptide repeat-containing protein [Ktedonobacterales bacterium]